MRGGLLGLVAITCACLSRPSPNGPTGGDGGPNPDSGSIDGQFSSSPNYVFVTSGKYDLTAIGGLPGANAKCMEAATVGGLPGAYIAWLSSSGSDAIAPLMQSRGWVRTDGRPFADRPLDISGGVILYPPILDESLHALAPNELVATGTASNGTAGLNCFSSPSTLAGFAGGGTDEWTQGAGPQPCTTLMHLYCFGVGNVVGLLKLPAGKLAFVSSPVSLVPMGNVGTLDSQCTTDAAAAGLAGRTFAAFAAADGGSAVQRFTNPMQPRTRVDGVVVTDDLSLFGQSPPSDAPLDQTAGGLYFDDTVFTGAGSPTVKALIANDNCSNWATNATSVDTRLGQSGRIGAPAFANGIAACDSTRRVYCIEQ